MEQNREISISYMLNKKSKIVSLTIQTSAFKYVIILENKHFMEAIKNEKHNKTKNLIMD